MNYTEAYNLLRISANTPPEAIKQAYKKQAKKYHPDVYTGDKKFAEEMMKKLNEAYELLTTPPPSPKATSTSQKTSSHNKTSSHSSFEDMWQKMEEDFAKMQQETDREEEEFLRKMGNDMNELHKREQQRQKLEKIFGIFAIIELIALIGGAIIVITFF